MERRLTTVVHACRHVAQECFCGEPNCMGFIGGKTQTDIGGMDDLYIDGASPSSSSFVQMLTLRFRPQLSVSRKRSKLSVYEVPRRRRVRSLMKTFWCVSVVFRSFARSSWDSPIVFRPCSPHFNRSSWTRYQKCRQQYDKRFNNGGFSRSSCRGFRCVRKESPDAVVGASAD